MRNDTKMIDCSFRDGGYYNNWYFSRNLVNKYFREIFNSNTSNIEVGFRLPIKNKITQNYGLLRCTPDYFLKRFNINDLFYCKQS
mgnify:CR=1 FL=1